MGLSISIIVWIYYLSKIHYSIYRSRRQYYESTSVGTNEYTTTMKSRIQRSIPNESPMAIIQPLANTAIAKPAIAVRIARKWES